MKILLSIFTILFLIIITIPACSNVETTTSLTLEITTPANQLTVVTTKEPITQIPVLPSSTNTPTPPLVALVNGVEILLEDYEAELARFQATVGTGLATFGEEVVMQDLIDQVLFAEAAKAAGFIVDDAMLNERIGALENGNQALDEWKLNYGYTDDSFLRAMRRAVASAWMRDQIIAEVPDTADQIHARQILLYNSIEAENIYSQLETGTDFGTLASEYEPLTKGDLGWFPRGYLLVPELDEVLFNLEPGEYSGIIQSPLGYHIIQVLERDPNHPLTADARRTLQVQALETWLKDHREMSDIEIMMP